MIDTTTYSPALKAALALKSIIWAHKDEHGLNLWAMGPPLPLNDNTAQSYTLEIVGSLGKFTVTVQS